MDGNEHRIGVVGIGDIADYHAKAIGDIDGATVVAGSCRTESKGREFADQYGCDWYADTERLLDEAQPDIVTIATPSGAHLEPALAAAERGVHVLCEKPLEITTDRIDRMIAAANEAGVELGVIFQQHFNPVMETVHDAASDGRLGRLATANAYVPWWRDDDYYGGSWKGTQELDGGGALMNQSIHGIDAVQWLANAAMPDINPDENPVEEVFAYSDTLAHDPDDVEVEDTAVAALKYRNGALGQVLGATSMYPGSLRRIQLGGRDGTVEIREDELVTWEFRDEEPADDEVRARFSDETEASGASDPMAIDYAGHTHSIAAFLDALDAGEPVPLDGTEARKSVAIIEAIYESAESGERVSVT